jgi:putative mRNA 3-end processing factor
MTSLLIPTDCGLYCPPGDFFIDPWRPVPRAVVTHAHSDHATRGCGHYLAARPGLPVLAERLGSDASIQPLPYRETITHHGVTLSLHPAGHVLGSAQVRLEHHGRVAVVSGDYKLAPDPTCEPFEPVPCHLFVTESTFGLPIYRWDPPDQIFDSINAWWSGNQSEGRASVLLAYALGKTQRLLAGIDRAMGPIYTHGAIEPLVRAYRKAGIDLPATTPVAEAPPRCDWSTALILAPPSAQGTPWLRRFGSASLAAASGWMTIRGTRRRRALDRGFPLSDHADWPGLWSAIRATGASEIWVTHGYVAPMVRALTEAGLEARAVATRFEGERDEPETASRTSADPAPPAPLEDDDPIPRDGMPISDA